MVDERTVLVTLGMTLALGVLAIAYLREPLRRVLFDICRKRDHARFWAASATCSCWPSRSPSSCCSSTWVRPPTRN